MMKFRKLGTLSTLLLVAVAIGCAPPPPYLRNYRFAPEPALTVMLKPGTQTPALSVLVSVIGIRRGDPDHGVPPAVEIKMRFENSGAETVTFDPQSLQLQTGSLQSFAKPEVHPPRAMEIAPGQTQSASLFFPFQPGASPGTVALDALRLRWQIIIDGKPYLQTVTFERASPL
ncbi:MAG TPA: hypothetical protein VFE47_24255 [Tepidisphaeraceae bacterium]|jgi:hypothetical protein|nr:hypothetical protein [Tepidisphaeraceae bacterium]